MRNLHKSIIELNSKGKAFVICITGESSSGKTSVSKYLYSKYPFYQYISLGLISKALRFALPLSKKNFEMGDNKFVNEKINEFLYECISYYGEKGVNTIIDGVQCDTEYLSKNPYLSGGIIIQAPIESRKKWSARPETHFNRQQDDNTLNSKISYIPTEKFVFLENREGVDICAKAEDVIEQLLLKEGISDTE